MITNQWNLKVELDLRTAAEDHGLDFDSLEERYHEFKAEVERPFKKNSSIVSRDVEEKMHPNYLEVAIERAINLHAYNHCNALALAFLSGDEERIQTAKAAVLAEPKVRQDYIKEKFRSGDNDNGAIASKCLHTSLPQIDVALDDNFDFSHSLSDDDLGTLRTVFTQRWAFFEDAISKRDSNIAEVKKSKVDKPEWLDKKYPLLAFDNNFLQFSKDEMEAYEAWRAYEDSYMKAAFTASDILIAKRITWEAENREYNFLSIPIHDPSRTHFDMGRLDAEDYWSQRKGTATCDHS